MVDATREVSGALVVVLWSQVTAFVARLERHGGHGAAATPTRKPNPSRDAITSYREEEDDGPQRPAAVPSASTSALLGAYRLLEQAAVERAASQPSTTAVDDDDDLNSLREQNDASVLSSFYKPEIVALLRQCFSCPEGQPKEARGAAPSGPDDELERRPRPAMDGKRLSPSSSRKIDEDQISTEGEDVDPHRTIFGTPLEDPALLHEVFNSSLFNFCLDRLVEARNRYHAKAVLRGEQHSKDPQPADPRKTRQEIQSVNSSSFDEAEPYVRKCEKLQERLLVQKRARELELREQARARRNLRVQVSAQLQLFREVADLAVSPIQFVEGASGSNSSGSSSSGTDTEYEDGPFPRRLAVPSVPPELAAVLRDERVYSPQVKRAVEAVVALKANQLDLVIANFTLEEVIRRHVKHTPPPLTRPPTWMPPPHHFRHLSAQARGAFFPPPVLLDSPPSSVLWERSRRFARRPFDLMSGSSAASIVPPLLHRHLPPPHLVSPVLRPLQSSPHVSSSDLGGEFPAYSRMLDESPPANPCQCATRWSPPALRRRREFDPVLEGPESNLDLLEDDSSPSVSPAYGYFGAVAHSREVTGSFGGPVMKSHSFVEAPVPYAPRELCQSLSAAGCADLTPAQSLAAEAKLKVSTPSKRGIKTVLGPGWQMVKKTMNQLARGASNANKQHKPASSACHDPPGLPTQHMCSMIDVDAGGSGQSRGSVSAHSHRRGVGASNDFHPPPQAHRGHMTSPHFPLEHARGRTMHSISPTGAMGGGPEDFLHRSTSTVKRSITNGPRTTTADGGDSQCSMACDA